MRENSEKAGSAGDLLSRSKPAGHKSSSASGVSSASGRKNQEMT
jgi:hypothetical protein